MNSLYLRSFSIDRTVPAGYAGEIPALKTLGTLEFHAPVTFLTGENGTGKSTLLEALAISCGLNPEGGTKNYRFSTYDDYSGLSAALRLVRGLHPRDSYFLRAESFYNVASVTALRYNDDGRLPDYHACSHGESFLTFLLGHDRAGLYFMDEPEAALSPQKQLTLIRHLHDTVEKGAQYVIATHSPILLALPGAEILSFSQEGVRPVAYEDAFPVQITRLFLENREAVLRELLNG